jgi:electron transfer flavoprotein beta subunit
MGYKCVVLVKQVPDTANISGKAMRDDGTVNRAALPAIFNPEDLNALEMALQVKEQHGGQVTVLTMGPPRAAEVLRQSLYRGADRVILLSDRKFAGSDTLATSYALKCAIERIGDYDLIFCGRQAIDGDTAATPPRWDHRLLRNWGFPRLRMQSLSSRCRTTRSSFAELFLSA